MIGAPHDSEICPRCEEGILIGAVTSQDITLAGSIIRVPNVRVEECRYCGFRSLSGKDVGLFDLLFAPQYARVADLVSALKAAGYADMFLKEDRSECNLAFGSRKYVAGLSDDLRSLYLDNESHHLIEGLAMLNSGTVPIDLGERRCTVKLPRLGEGENGLVYEYQEDGQAVLKLAKPRAYSRNHLRAEHEVTSIFESRGIPVPRILESDPYGSFMIKEKLAGESLARVYDTLDRSDNPYYQKVRSTVESFIERLLVLFREYPETKTSISPNNIFIISSGEECRCLLVDTGPAPFHDYSNFSFSEYWSTVIPQKIKQYKTVGYL
jgi:YgiT-type zinc finger domain-containing protein